MTPRPRLIHAKALLEVRYASTVDHSQDPRASPSLSEYTEKNVLDLPSRDTPGWLENIG